MALRTRFIIRSQTGRELFSKYPLGWHISDAYGRQTTALQHFLDPGPVTFLAFVEDRKELKVIFVPDTVLLAPWWGWNVLTYRREDCLLKEFGE